MSTHYEGTSTYTVQGCPDCALIKVTRTQTYFIGKLGKEKLHAGFLLKGLQPLPKFTADQLCDCDGDEDEADD